MFSLIHIAGLLFSCYVLATFQSRKYHPLVPVGFRRISNRLVISFTSQIVQETRDEHRKALPSQTVNRNNNLPFEEQYNNHHLYPKSARSGFLSYHVGLACYYIELLNMIVSVITYTDNRFPIALHVQDYQEPASELIAF